MRYRKKESRSSRKRFGRSAGRTHRKNDTSTIKRGGIRL